MIYTTRVKEEQRENKSQRFQGKFVFCATLQREKRNTRILKLLRSTRRIKRTLAFGTFVETNDDSFSSSFSSRIFVSLAIFMCLLLLLVIAQKSDREERTCLNPNSLQNPKHKHFAKRVSYFQKSVVSAPKFVALYSSQLTLSFPLFLRARSVHYCVESLFLWLFLWLLRRVKKEEQRLQIFKCHNPARCASRRNHHHPLVNECGRPRPGNERGSNKRRRKRRP